MTNPSAAAQEFARPFNHDEDVWQEFARLRALRRLDAASFALPGDLADALDWLAAVDGSLVARVHPTP